MAGHGPAPKATRSRKRDTDRRSGEMRAVQADGRTRGPALPADALPDGDDWHPRTRAWWSTWRKSAQAQAFTATDWDFLLDTALMHHVMWSKGKWEFASELRLRAAKFGATPEDRLRLRIQVDPAGGKEPARRPAADGPVTDISSRRARLTE